MGQHPAFSLQPVAQLVLIEDGLRSDRGPIDVNRALDLRSDDLHRRDLPTATFSAVPLVVLAGAAAKDPAPVMALVDRIAERPDRRARVNRSHGDVRNSKAMLGPGREQLLAHQLDEGARSCTGPLAVELQIVGQTLDHPDPVLLVDQSRVVHLQPGDETDIASILSVGLAHREDLSAMLRLLR